VTVIAPQLNGLNSLLQVNANVFPETNPFKSTSKIALASPELCVPEIAQVPLYEYGPRWFGAMLWPTPLAPIAMSSVKLMPEVAVVPGMMW